MRWTSLVIAVAATALLSGRVARAEENKVRESDLKGAVVVTLVKGGESKTVTEKLD